MHSYSVVVVKQLGEGDQKHGQSLNSSLVVGEVSLKNKSLSKLECKLGSSD